MLKPRSLFICGVYGIHNTLCEHECSVESRRLLLTYLISNLPPRALEHNKIHQPNVKHPCADEVTEAGCTHQNIFKWTDGDVCRTFWSLYPMKSIRFVCLGRSHKSEPIMCERCYKSARLTVGFQRQRRRRAQNPSVCHRVLHQADVAADVGRLHLGDVEVPCVLGDEAPAVFSHEWRELVKHPAVDDLCKSRHMHIERSLFVKSLFDAL